MLFFGWTSLQGRDEAIWLLLASERVREKTALGDLSTKRRCWLYRRFLLTSLRMYVLGET